MTASSRILHLHRWEGGDTNRNRYYELPALPAAVTDGIYALTNNENESYVRFPKLTVVDENEPVIGALLSLPGVRQVRVRGYRIGILAASPEHLEVEHANVVEILRRDACSQHRDAEVVPMAGEFCLMRGFRSPKPTETHLAAWNMTGACDTAADAVAYFFSHAGYWPWSSQKNCGVRVYGYVFGPPGTELHFDTASGAPYLRTPDGEPELTGAAVKEMSSSDLWDRGFRRQFI